VSTEFAELDATQEWEISEPLMRALGGIPLHPRAYRRHVISEVKPLVEDALGTLAILEQLRQLTTKERRQARTLQSFLAALEEEEMEVRAG
jgi:hypothetical protein